ncbi:HIRAN domain-containing protein [Nitrosomonas sp. Is35]|uniref:HIRAN domain-containing protein n=1 Tax=Nitrosomonas sp. Is35 TaxID=3080534 RepID=UPI00294AE388|nr:HIRAN domain-containing protein [Nitrosomonas sp. Is35]MDV6346090.1 HIRAN domain-containing protein [Nitrosomonas sp. Is35]
MSRRVFLQSFTALLGGFAFPALLQSKPELNQWKTLQISPVAGFQYHHGETLWPQLATRQTVTLIREPSNRFDQRTVRIDWQGEKLGYIPAKDNAAVSQLLDRGETMSALIVGLKKSNNPWERIEVEVRWRT